jgi:hypothetical protein
VIEVARRSEPPPYRQAVPALGLSLERGTKDVPDDGRFHVVIDGTVAYSSDSKKDALSEYRLLRDRLLPPTKTAIDVRRILEKEVGEREIDQFLADSTRMKRARALRKGGKGGSGGVG